jgi:hypothetical protein
MDRELGSVRCCESSFCDWVNHDYFKHIKIYVISESPTAIHSHSARTWQAVSTKDVPCFQLLFEGACRQIQFSEGCSWVAAYCQSIVSIIVRVYWCSFMSDIFLSLLISVLLRPPNSSNFHGSSFWLVVIEGRTLYYFSNSISQALARSCGGEKYGSGSIEIMCGDDLQEKITKCFKLSES